jgi:hypothetical protein
MLTKGRGRQRQALQTKECLPEKILLTTWIAVAVSTGEFDLRHDYCFRESRAAKQEETNEFSSRGSLASASSDRDLSTSMAYH